MPLCTSSLSNREVARKVLVTVHVPVCRQLNCCLSAAKMFGWWKSALAHASEKEIDVEDNDVFRDKFWS